jgi:hypothetical protein
MGNFNEIQNGMPDLGKTYWQDLKNEETSENEVSEIVKMNCQTIFDPNNALKNTIKPSIFNE